MGRVLFPEFVRKQQSGLSSELGVRLTCAQVLAVLVQPALDWLLYLWGTINSRVKWGQHPLVYCGCTAHTLKKGAGE